MTTVNVLVYRTRSDDEPTLYTGVEISELSTIEYPINRTIVHSGYVNASDIGIENRMYPILVFAESHIDSTLTPTIFEIYLD